MYQLTNNYRGYKKLKVILERGLEKVEALLVQSKPDIDTRPTLNTGNQNEDRAHYQLNPK